MDPRHLPTFLEDAESFLPSIRSGILVFAKDGVARSLELPIRRIEAIKNGAAAFELAEIEVSSELMEDMMFNLVASTEPLEPRSVRDLLDILARIEAQLIQKRHSCDPNPIDISGFVDDSFDILQIEKPSGSPVGNVELVLDEPAKAPAAEAFRMEDVPAEDGFEIDAEMLEVFRMEADDLLRNIGSSLDVIGRDPANTDALWEIRRNAHTFKGAAGIVGFKQPSELAHRVEDLLDHLAEHKISSNGSIYGLLVSAFDCLNAMTNGDLSPQLGAKTAGVYSRFEEMMTSLQSPSAPVDVREISSAPEQLTTVLPTAPAEITEAQPRPRQPRSIVRVSLSRLDELARIVRDLVVSRSLFEQRLSEFEQQIEELHNSTRRLQSTNSKLEIDFEASMLGSGSSFGFNPSSIDKTFGGIDEFDALEFDRYTDFHQTTRELTETTSDTFAINSALDSLRGNFETLFDSQRRLIEEMQEKLMRMRMVEFGTMSTRLQRAVRVTCEEENKKAEIVIENESHEVDTQILDSLIEPLLHVLRNAVVHGIENTETRRLLGKPEKGLIKLKISNEETHIALTVSDDGRGIVTSALKEKAVMNGSISRERADAMTEAELLNLIFLPGLTTAERLSLSAGRGVGMSIVKESMEAHQGTVTIRSEPQVGTRITLRMPLALAVTNVLLVKVAAQTYALPIKLVKHISEVGSDEINGYGGERSLRIGEEKYPLSSLSDYIGVPGIDGFEPATVPTLLVETSEKTSALTVDEIIRSEEIVIRSFGKPLENLKGLLGAAMLANGELVPILDLPYLLMNNFRKASNATVGVIETPAEVSVMIVDDSPSVRHMTSKVIANAGWSVVTARDGIEALELLQGSRVPPAVILTDVEMPRMDGYEFVASLKRNAALKDIPVIMITSRAAEKHREKAFATGVDEYLAKPYNDAELVSSIKRLTNVD